MKIVAYTLSRKTIRRTHVPLWPKVKCPDLSSDAILRSLSTQHLPVLPLNLQIKLMKVDNDTALLVTWFISCRNIRVFNANCDCFSFFDDYMDLSKCPVPR